MRNAKCSTCTVIYKRLSEMQLNERDRRAAMYAMRDGAAIAEGVIWVKDRIASLGAVLLKPSFRQS